MILEKTTTKKENSVSPADRGNGSRYIESVGRRKTSVARVRLTPASKFSMSVNDKDMEKYFPTPALRMTVLSIFNDIEKNFLITAKIKGGGISSQAEALRHGLGRALVSLDLNLRTQLKLKGFLKRDPRAKERRKFGLKKARKAPKWSKR